jgi:hypothetical protein
MRLFQLFEDTQKNTLVIFPGRFQPVTRNHFNVYQYLCKSFGQKNVFIASSNKVEPPRSPFSFEEKKALLSFIGVDPSHIIETKSPYMAREITEHYDPNTTVLIFAVGQKDMEEDPRFNFKPKKDGSPSYFQPYNPKAKLETFDKHAYITPIPNFKFELGGQVVMGATQIRKMFADSDEQQQKKLFTELYGKFDPKLFAMVSQKLSGQIGEVLNPNLKNKLKKAGACAAMTIGLAGAAMHQPNDQDHERELAKYMQIQRRKERDDKNTNSDQTKPYRKSVVQNPDR